MNQNCKYSINPKLDFVSEEAVSVFIDEEKDLVHFMEDLEMEIIEMLKTPISFSELLEKVSGLYEGFVEEEFLAFFEDLLSKEIVSEME